MEAGALVHTSFLGIPCCPVLPQFALFLPHFAHVGGNQTKALAAQTVYLLNSSCFKNVTCLHKILVRKFTPADLAGPCAKSQSLLQVVCATAVAFEPLF